MNNDKSICIRSSYFLHGISLLNSSIANKNLNLCPYICSVHAYYVYRAEDSTKVWTVLAHVAGVRPFTKIASSYLMVNRTRNVSEVLFPPLPTAIPASYRFYSLLQKSFYPLLSPYLTSFVFYSMFQRDQHIQTTLGCPAASSVVFKDAPFDVRGNRHLTPPITGNYRTQKGA